MEIGNIIGENRREKIEAKNYHRKCDTRLSRTVIAIKESLLFQGRTAHVQTRPTPDKCSVVL